MEVYECIWLYIGNIPPSLHSLPSRSLSPLPSSPSPAPLLFPFASFPPSLSLPLPLSLSLSPSLLPPGAPIYNDPLKGSHRGVPLKRGTATTRDHLVLDAPVAGLRGHCGRPRMAPHRFGPHAGYDAGIARARRPLRRRLLRSKSRRHLLHRRSMHGYAFRALGACDRAREVSR